MDRQKVVNTFQGLDVDTSVNKYSNEKYFSCKNFRGLLNEENGSFALVNTKGNKVVAEITARTNDPVDILGIGEFTDSVVIFVRGVTVIHIPKADLENYTKIDLNNDNPPYVILKDKDFGVTFTNSLRIICREETSDIKKVYFTDGIQDLRVINIADENIDDYDINKFSIVPDVEYTSINTSISFGNLKAGKVGYAYQLYNTYGAESRFSPVSPLLSIFDSPTVTPRLIRGSDIGKVTNKGVGISISNLDSRFDRIRLVRVHYEDIVQEPSIDVIDESPFDDSYTFTDIGLQSLDTYVVEEFNELLVSPIPQTIETKNNYMFAGNVKDDTFDVEYDAEQNVSYNFVTSDIIIDELDSNSPLFAGSNSTTNSTLSHVNTTRKLGFQRDEIYRVGIILFDKRLRPSFVKHIGDIRIPDASNNNGNTPIPITEYISNKVSAKNIQIEFTVSGLPDSVQAYQIVCVPRTRELRSVLDMGYVGITRDAVNEQYDLEYGSHNAILFGTQIVEYASPEVTYNKLEEPGTVLQRVETAGINSNVVITSGDFDFRLKKFRRSSTNTPLIDKNIDDGILSAYSGDFDDSVIINNKRVRKRILKTGDDSLSNTDATIAASGYKNTNMLLHIPDWVSEDFTYNSENIIAICRRRKNYVNSNPVNFYGKIDGNAFIPVSPIIKKGTPVTAWGDTYINMFEYFRGAYKGDGSNYGECMSFPVETSIDLTLISNPTFNTLFESVNIGDIEGSMPDFRFMKEVAGEWGFEDNIIFSQDFDWYTYNTVYSRTNNIKNYFVKPKDIKFNSVFNNRFYYSDKKTNGEFTDSWIKFRPNNFIDLDSKYGKLSRLYNFKDTLFAFQDKAVSAIPVEQRELVQTNTPGPLVAGLGDVVSNPHYMSSESGLSEHDALTSSRNAIYYFDRENNKLCRVGQTVEFISDIGNISSLINKYKDGINKPVLTYDRAYNEVLFKLVNREVLVFNEYKNLFTGTYSYGFENSFSFGNKLFVTDTGKVIKIGDGNYGDFLRTVENSTLTLILNPVGNQNVLFDVVELTHEIFKDGSLLPNEAVESIRLYNEYQDTGEIYLNNEDVAQQRFRTWKVNTLVDKGEDEGRIRSASVFLDITFRNIDNKKIVLHDLITSIRPTKIR